jgi:hypothetical protein
MKVYKLRILVEFGENSMRTQIRNHKITKIIENELENYELILEYFESIIQKYFY